MIIRVDAPDGAREIVDCDRAGLAYPLRTLFDAALDDVSRGRVPPLYESGVRYAQERPRDVRRHGEAWNRPARVAGLGHGDCEDLACWRAAELVVSGADPRAIPYIRPAGRGMHALVSREWGVEDPSAALGMPTRRPLGTQWGLARAPDGRAVAGADTIIAPWAMVRARARAATPAVACAGAAEVVSGVLDDLGIDAGAAADGAIDDILTGLSPEALAAKGIDIAVGWVNDAIAWLTDSIGDFIDRISNHDTYRSASYRAAEAAWSAQSACERAQRRMPAGRDRTMRPGRRAAEAEIISREETAAARSDPTAFPVLVAKLLLLRRISIAYFHDHQALRDWYSNGLLDAGWPADSVRAMSANVKITEISGDNWRFSTAVDLDAAPEATRARVADVAREVGSQKSAWLIMFQLGNDAYGVIDARPDKPPDWYQSLALSLTPAHAGVWGAPSRTLPIRRAGLPVQTVMLSRVAREPVAVADASAAIAARDWDAARAAVERLADGADPRRARRVATFLRRLAQWERGDARAVASRLRGYARLAV